MEPHELAPRICDCDYCKSHPSAVLSHPELVVAVASTAPLFTATNGSGQGTFYHCPHCQQLIAVGAVLGGVSRGAVNGFLFGDLTQFAEPMAIQPRLLAPEEKLARWSRVWGRVTFGAAP